MPKKTPPRGGGATVCQNGKSGAKDARKFWAGKMHWLRRRHKKISVSLTPGHVVLTFQEQSIHVRQIGCHLQLLALIFFHFKLVLGSLTVRQGQWTLQRGTLSLQLGANLRTPPKKLPPPPMPFCLRKGTPPGGAWAGRRPRA